MNQPIRNIAAVLSMLLIIPMHAAALEVDRDGRALIQEASEAYARDMQERPIVEDKAILDYVNQVAERLVLAGPGLPAGVSLKVSVVESDVPELYSYADGHVVMSTAMLYSARNEAQLAALLSHEVAHVSEGHYIELYQQIKAAEQKKRNMAIVGAVIGGLMDVAVDTAAEYREVEEEEKLLNGEQTYGETMKKIAVIEGGKSAYFTMKDVAASVPPEDANGHKMDPRFQFEPLADAQGMQYLARAGYDVAEAAEAWGNVARLRNRQLKERQAMLGDMGRQLSQMTAMFQKQSEQMMQKTGLASGLAKTISVAPRGRAELMHSLLNMQEVREAAHGSEKGEAAFRDFLSRTLLAKARLAMQEERYEEAARRYQAIHDSGIRLPEVSYGLARSRLGDFAFGASEADKRRSESLYREALAMNRNYAPAWKGLAELYEDWERYEDALDAYGHYRRLAPKAERKRIDRKMRVLKRRAAR